jgi:alpha-glucosidase
VEREAADPRSTLVFVRRLAELRATVPVLQGGRQTTLDAGPDVLAWRRDDGDARVLAAVNFGLTSVALTLDLTGASVLVSTDPDRAPGPAGAEPVVLGPSEGVLLQLL